MDNIPRFDTCVPELPAVHALLGLCLARLCCWPPLVSWARCQGLELPIKAAGRSRTACRAVRQRQEDVLLLTRGVWVLVTSFVDKNIRHFVQ